MDRRIESKKNKFLKLTPENELYNQYWFSEDTIKFFIEQVTKYGKEKIGFIATPSIFFTLSKEMQNKSYVFDIDEKLTKKHPNGRKYDFNDGDYEAKFPDLKHSFDYLVIDPPFITEEAWSKFANFAFVSIAPIIIVKQSLLNNDDFLGIANYFIDNALDAYNRLLKLKN